MEKAKSCVFEVQDLSISYGPRRILSAVSVGLNWGEIVGVFAPAAEGKSTLLKGLMGLVLSDDGEILFLGESIARKRADCRARLGIIFQPDRGALFPSLTVGENYALYLSAARKWSSVPENPLAVCSDWYKPFVGLIKRRAGLISGGESQIAAFLRYLIAPPKVMLLDEPFRSLSEDSKDMVRKGLREIAERGVAIIVTSEDRKDLAGTASQNYVLSAGRLVRSGSN